MKDVKNLKFVFFQLLLVDPEYFFDFKKRAFILGNHVASEM